MDTASQRSSTSKQSATSTQKDKTLLKIVNKIFAANGVAQVRNLSTDFADARLFVVLFNLLFDEKVDLKLSTVNSVEAKTLNWNKVNATICFNYLQQQFILIGSTMKALGAGKKQAAAKAIVCLLECTLGTQFESYLDDGAIRDIANVVNFDIDFEEADKAKKDLEGEHQQQPSEENKTDDGGKSEFVERANQRKNQGQKVCIVEDDIAMTEEEMEMLQQMQEDREREAQEKKDAKKVKKSPVKK